VRRTLRRLVGPVVLAGLTGALLFLGVLPARTYLDQRQATAEVEERLDELLTQNEALQGQVDTLSTDAELERLAREQYGLAKPDEEIYHVLPPPQDPVAAPEAWPFERLAPGTQP
jgi:cell division protein FtsB